MEPLGSHCQPWDYFPFFPPCLSLAVGKYVLGAPRPQPNKSELACRFPKKGSPGLFKAVNGAPHLGSIIPGPSFPLPFFTSFRGLLTSTNSIIIPPGLLSPPFRSTLSRPSSPPTQGSPIPISQLLGPSPFPLLSCLPAHFFFNHFLFELDTQEPSRASVVHPGSSPEWSSATDAQTDAVCVCQAVQKHQPKNEAQSTVMTLPFPQTHLGPCEPCQPILPSQQELGHSCACPWMRYVLLTSASTEPGIPYLYSENLDPNGSQTNLPAYMRSFQNLAGTRSPSDVPQ